MIDALPWIFPTLTLVTLVTIPLYAGLRRGRFYSIFSAIVLGLTALGAGLVYFRMADYVPAAALPWLQVAFALGMLSTAAHYASLVNARMRGRAFRGLISIPGQVFLAAGFMSTFWLLALLIPRALLWAFGANTLLGWLAPLDLLPYAVAFVAAFTSPRLSPELVRLKLGTARPENFSRVPMERHRRKKPEPLAERPLRVVQIADPHLGPWQPVARLQRIVAELVAREPDLILLTGDFLTMESNATAGALAEALSPLRELPGRCFAVFGNHDHEAPDEVKAGLSANGVRLLNDDSCAAETPTGPVQIVGADYVSKGRGEHLTQLLADHPRIEGHRRLLLLHDPSAFHDLPDDAVDLVLSGHTHGGQMGLVSFGFNWTVLAHSRWPDHGHFARGSNHLYVHRGTGFYGFPLRVGVPGEASMLELSWD
ncbi:MAG: metallophosphoesterase [Myxococcota bacterium]|nr:metallophosphoesterase [Myxococcota bacterium]